MYFDYIIFQIYQLLNVSEKQKLFKNVIGLNNSKCMFDYYEPELILVV